MYVHLWRIGIHNQRQARSTPGNYMYTCGVQGFQLAPGLALRGLEGGIYYAFTWVCAVLLCTAL
jgi:hypothetical protein